MSKAGNSLSALVSPPLSSDPEHSWTILNTDSRFHSKAKRTQTQAVQIVLLSTRFGKEDLGALCLGMMRRRGVSAPHRWMSQPSLHSCRSTAAWGVCLQIFKTDDRLTFSLWLQDSSCLLLSISSYPHLSQRGGKKRTEERSIRSTIAPGTVTIGSTHTINATNYSKLYLAF